MLAAKRIRDERRNPPAKRRLEDREEPAAKRAHDIYTDPALFFSVLCPDLRAYLHEWVAPIRVTLHKLDGWRTVIELPRDITVGAALSLMAQCDPDGMAEASMRFIWKGRVLGTLPERRLDAVFETRDETVHIVLALRGD